jgi:hypothetical protein
MTPAEIVSTYPDVQIYEGRTSEGLRIAILRGGLGQPNPTEYMDNIVSEFVENRGYNEFIERFLDNPWVRVILEGINEIAEDSWRSGTSLQ